MTDKDEAHTTHEKIQLIKDKRIKELEVELERERMRLAACGTAALGYFKGCIDEYKSASLDDVLGLQSKLTEAEEMLKAEMDVSADRFEEEARKVEGSRFKDSVRTDLSDDERNRRRIERVASALRQEHQRTKEEDLELAKRLPPSIHRNMMLKSIRASKEEK